MKQLVKVQKIKNKGLLALMGQRVTLFGANYIYTGTLVGVNDEFVKLEKGGIVFETGAFTDAKWKDYQPFPGDGVGYVMKSAIESFLILKQ